MPSKTVPPTAEELGELLNGIAAEVKVDPVKYFEKLAGANNLPGPPTIEEKKSWVFRVVYFLGRQMRRALVFVQHWGLPFLYSAFVLASIIVGTYFIGTWLFAINPLLYYSLLVAVAAQLITSVAAFSGKILIDHRRRTLNARELALA